MGAAWDMAVYRRTPSESFAQNILSFGIGEVAGYGFNKLLGNPSVQRAMRRAKEFATDVAMAPLGLLMGVGNGVPQTPRKAMVLGYRGVGIGREEFKNRGSDYDLLRYGHVGFSINEGRTIYGFRPTEEAEHDLILKHIDVDQWLKNHNTMPGRLHDDTSAFQLAYNMFQQGEPRPEVIQLTQTITEEQYRRIVAEINNSALSPYRLPVEDPMTGDALPMPVWCNNCATYPRTFGLWAIESGQLRDWMKAIRAAGGTPWKPPQ